MAYDVNRRLNKAERVTNPSFAIPCAECGGEPPPDAEVEVLWEDDLTDEELGPKHCPACGRELYKDIWFDSEIDFDFPSRELDLRG